ncbi:hypothetical protein PoB_001098900 [Plakobranchus ocellatus]|uniref:Uncharacterized protein n=1 Tax=Plakobranchus ocellatus TaxID=259542 RepID=A0AAV3YQY1_9GAST|nr:hypothetical protein PoB_001098900 [Plakobranchus ocellatus]
MRATAGKSTRLEVKKFFNHNMLSKMAGPAGLRFEEAEYKSCEKICEEDVKSKLFLITFGPFWTVAKTFSTEDLLKGIQLNGDKAALSSRCADPSLPPPSSRVRISSVEA